MRCSAKYARLSDGKEILARAKLVAEDVSKPDGPRRATVDELTKMATERGTGDLLKVCRTVSELWDETVGHTFDGSFRYWGKSRASQWRMVFGINVAAKAKPPHGQPDVWVPAPSVAEVTGRPENDVRAALERQPIANIHMGKNDPCWIRLKTVEEARGLVQQLREFASEASVAKV
jgi:hypothetical protein